VNLRRLVGYRKDCHGTIANVSAIAPGMEAAETEKMNHTRLGKHPGRVSAFVAILLKSLIICSFRGKGKDRNFDTLGTKITVFL
jgi:hypothetical protein